VDGRSDAHPQHAPKKQIGNKSRQSMPFTNGCNSNPKREVRLGLFDVSKAKPPLLHYSGGFWRVWVAYNTTLTAGTYILLHNNGDMMRVTVHPDGTESYNAL
jgi:hypothetical protein